MYNFFLGAESNNGNGATTWILVGLLVVLIVVLLVVPMFTNKKRAKQTMELHNSLKPGDVIKTVGGIIGTIKDIRQVSPAEREMVIETGEGDNKSTMTFDIQALYQIISRVDAGTSSSEVFADEPEKTEDVKAEPDVTEKFDTPVEEKEPVAEPEKTVETSEKSEAVTTDPETAAVNNEAENEPEPETPKVEIKAEVKPTAPRKKTSSPQAKKPVKKSTSATSKTTSTKK